MLRRGPRRWVAATVAILAVAAVLQWLAPPWYDVDVGSFVLGLVSMLAFLTLATVLFDVFWPMNGSSHRH